MAAIYQKAPISELTFGIVFKTNILLNNGVLFKVLYELNKEFPIINTHPTMGEEDVLNNLIQTTTDYAKAGFSTYRLSTADGKWHIILLQHFIELHWLRQDNEAVGYYPGFTEVHLKFKTILSIITKIHGEEDTLKQSIKSYTLGYTDRVNLSAITLAEVAKPQIDQIITIPSPSFSINEHIYSANNYFCRYSVFCEEIKGHSIITINTPTLQDIGKILIVDNKLKGFNPDLNIDEWFAMGHAIQISFFEKIFSIEVLKTWK